MTKIRNYPLDTVIQDTDTLIGTDEGNYGATKTFPVASLSAYINEQGPQGTVTSISGTGTVSGITLSGTVTESGSLNLGGSLSLTSQEIINFLGYTPYDATNPEGYTSFAEPAIFSGGGTPTLATGVTAEEVRTLIGISDGAAGGVTSITAGSNIAINPSLGVGDVTVSSPDVIVNTEDTFTSTPKITNIVSLTEAEYTALSVKENDTLYILI